MVVTFTNGARSDGRMRTSGTEVMCNASGAIERSRGTSLDGG